MATAMEMMTELSDAEIDVVSFNPSEEKIINFDTLVEELLDDYHEKSDNLTDTDSDEDDEIIDVINTSAIAENICNRDSGIFNMQDTCTSLDENVNISCNDTSAKVSLKRKRQNLDKDESRPEISKRTKIESNRSNTLLNHSGKSFSQSNKEDLNADGSSKSIETNHAEINELKKSHYCPQCDVTVDVTGPRDRKLCIVCKACTLYQCNKCGYQTKLYSTIIGHLAKVCYFEKIWRCDHCNFQSKMKYNLTRHIRRKHTSIPNEQRSPRKLQVCDQSNSKSGKSNSEFDVDFQVPDKAFAISAKSANLKFTILTCTNCNISTMASDRNSDKCPKCTADMVFSCEKCSLKLSGLPEAFDHLNKNCSFKRYRCNDCHFEYSHKRYLNEHVKRMHSLSNLKCSICHNTYKNNVSLRIHMKTCMREPHIACCLCSYTTKFYSNFYVHVKTKHSDQFDTADEYRDLRRSLIKVEKSVQVERSPKTVYYCPLCEKLVDATGPFYKKQCMQCKTIILYECNNCGKRYDKYYSLRNHHYLICSRKILSCDHCKFTTRESATLQRHIVSKHMHMLEGRKSEATT